MRYCWMANKVKIFSTHLVKFNWNIVLKYLKAMIKLKVTKYLLIIIKTRLNNVKIFKNLLWLI